MAKKKNPIFYVADVAPRYNDDSGDESSDSQQEQSEQNEQNELNDQNDQNDQSKTISKSTLRDEKDSPMFDAATNPVVTSNATGVEDPGPDNAANAANCPENAAGAANCPNNAGAAHSVAINVAKTKKSQVIDEFVVI